MKHYIELITLMFPACQNTHFLPFMVANSYITCWFGLLFLTQNGELPGPLTDDSKEANQQPMHQEPSGTMTDDSKEATRISHSQQVRLCKVLNFES